MRQQDSRDRSAEIQMLLNVAKRHEQHDSPEARAAAQTARERARELMQMRQSPPRSQQQPIEPMNLIGSMGLTP